MRILITGAAGFIGSTLADVLAAGGEEVLGVDDFTTGRQENVGDWECHSIDIVDRHALYAFANHLEPDLVIHAAASYSDPDKWHRDTRTNVEGSINAALISRHHGARLVYFQTALPPVSSYAISKHAGLAYLELSGVPLLTFRLANIYGPRNMSGPIPAFYKRLTAGERCTVFDTRRDTVYIDDLVELVLDAIDQDATGAYDVCSGEAYPIRRYFDAVADALELDDEPDEQPRSEDDLEEMTFDTGPAFRDFDWMTFTPLEEGIARTVASYAEGGVGPVYTHLKGATT